MKKLFAILVALIAATATPAFAQNMTMLAPVIPVVPFGITGTVMANGWPVPNATVNLKRVDYDYQTREYFANPATATKVTTDSNGRYFAKDLPAPLDGFSSWREVQVQAEAPGLIHFTSEALRFRLDGRSLVSAPDIVMWNAGLKTSQAYMWWEREGVVAVGFWARIEGWSETLAIDFRFKGSSWTKAEADYGSVTVFAEIDPTTKWIQRKFYAPQGVVYGESFCAEVSLKGVYDARDGRENLKQVCVGLMPTPIVIGLQAK